MADFVRFILEFRHRFSGKSECFSATSMKKQPYIRTDILMYRKPFSRIQHFLLEKSVFVEFKLLSYPVRKEFGDIGLSIFLLSIFATFLVFLNAFTWLSYICLAFATSYFCNSVYKDHTSGPLDVIRKTTIRPFKKNTGVTFVILDMLSTLVSQQSSMKLWLLIMMKEMTEGTMEGSEMSQMTTKIRNLILTVALMNMRKSSMRIDLQ
jgi:hypothetical protein